MPIESRLYSDGLFSFAKLTALRHRAPIMLRTGRRTVSTSVRDNAEITIVGELPPQTANALPRILSSGSAMIKEWATVVSAKR